jgi:hypothetical protein
VSYPSYGSAWASASPSSAPAIASVLVFTVAWIGGLSEVGGVGIDVGPSPKIVVAATAADAGKTERVGCTELAWRRSSTSRD